MEDQAQSLVEELEKLRQAIDDQTIALWVSNQDGLKLDAEVVWVNRMNASGALQRALNRRRADGIEAYATTEELKKGRG
ncbi:MAG: hypothetical protein OXP74_03230 [Acidobacteriota bacterium]|nr:hypothetical protein [Acidobacteriota bacterium]